MASRIEKLDFLINKKKNVTDINVGLLLSEFSCFDAIVGAEYELYDANGVLTGRMKRKPISAEQIGELMKALEEMLKAKNKKR